jgi:large subunit ribosomal protein L31e
LTEKAANAEEIPQEKDTSEPLEQSDEGPAEETEATVAAEEETVAEEPAEEIEEAKEEARPEEEEGEEEVQIVEERVYTIPFRRVWATPRGKRTPHASRMLRDFARRHMKSDDVKISSEVNEELWDRGIKKPPRQIKVRIVKDKEGKVIVYPATGA